MQTAKHNRFFPCFLTPSLYSKEHLNTCPRKSVLRCVFISLNPGSYYKETSHEPHGVGASGELLWLEKRPKLCLYVLPPPAHRNSKHSSHRESLGENYFLSQLCGTWQRSRISDKQWQHLLLPPSQLPVSRRTRPRQRDKLRAVTAARPHCGFLTGTARSSLASPRTISRRTRLFGEH